ncbi:MAG: hypothetical protein ABI747_03200 [Candidatus Moraniibacteriota bacterium]
MSYQVLAILGAVGIALALGDILMKEWSTGQSASLLSHHAWYVAAILVYAIALSVYGFMLRRADFAAASYSILIFNMIVVALVGYIFFPDRLSLVELAGIFLGIGSIACFTISRY